jgi:hypothetical protein
MNLILLQFDFNFNRNFDHDFSDDYKWREVSQHIMQDGTMKERLISFIYSQFQVFNFQKIFSEK